MLIKYILLLCIFCFTTTSNANNSIVTINDPAVSSGYHTSYYINTAANTSPETHIIGLYETRSDHSFGYHPVGTAHVHITGSTSVPVNLVLSSYEPTQWILDGAGISYVQSVLINSYEASSVTGIDTSKAQNINLGAYTYTWPDFYTSRLVSAVESLYGAPISTFSGVYRATDITVALAPIPEPSSAILLLSGLGIVGMSLRKKN